MLSHLRYFIVGISLLAICSCQEGLEDKAERQAKEYTHKYCPTPIYNSNRTDSIVFDKNRKVYIYYISFCDKLDDQEVIDHNRNLICNMLTQSVRESTSLKGFLEAGFKFEYVCRSAKNPKKVMLKVVI